MAVSTFVVYDTTTGAIVCAYRSPTAPTPDTGQAVLNTGDDPVPAPDTHRVDLGGPTVVAKTAQEQDDAANAQRKADIERTLGTLDPVRTAMAARSFSVTALDAEIATLEAELASLP